MLQVVSGGVRSGKSTCAEGLIKEDKVYIATMKWVDKETKKRIALHKERRMSSWENFEVFEDLKYIDQYKGKEVLLDCLTNLVTNELLNGVNCDIIVNKIVRAIKDINSHARKLVVVTNNVFEELENYSNLTKDFLDVLGRVSTEVCRFADEVIICEYGLCEKIGG